MPASSQQLARPATSPASPTVDNLRASCLSLPRELGTPRDRDTFRGSFGPEFLFRDVTMGFASGSSSFRRFAVMGDSPKVIAQSMLDALSEHALRVADIGAPEEIEYGWSGGRHILDGTFSFDHNVFGDALVFGLRIDTNRVPGEL